MTEADRPESVPQPAGPTVSVPPRSETAGAATAPAAPVAGPGTAPAPPPAAASPSTVAALPSAEPFVPLPGSAAADPAVQAARAEVEAARVSFQGEVGELRASAGRAVDIRAKLRGLPGRIKEDPRPFLAAVGASTALVVGVRALRRRGRSRYPAGILPPSVEEILRGTEDGDRIRKELADTFGAYLEEHGFQPKGRRRGIPTVVTFVVLPLVSTLGREAIRRAMRGTMQDDLARAIPGRGDGTKSAGPSGRG